VVLADGINKSAGGVDGHVGVSNVLRRSDGPWRGVAVLSVEALVVEVGEVERPVMDGEVSTPVLVDAAAGVVALGHQVLDAPVRVPPADHDPSAVVGTQLGPAEVGAVPAQQLVAELDPAVVKQELGGDRRGPRAVRRGFQGAPAIFTVGIRVPIKA